MHEEFGKRQYRTLNFRNVWLYNSVIIRDTYTHLVSWYPPNLGDHDSVLKSSLQMFWLCDKSQWIQLWLGIAFECLYNNLFVLQSSNVSLILVNMVALALIKLCMLATFANVHLTTLAPTVKQVSYISHYFNLLTSVSLENLGY